MNEFLVSLSDLSPGPACVIPEEKKIFRVTTEEPAADLTVGAATASEAPLDEPRLPVPHMYSA